MKTSLAVLGVFLIAATWANAEVPVQSVWALCHERAE